MVTIWDVILSTVGSPGGLYAEEPCDVKGYHLAVIGRVDCGEQNGNWETSWSVTAMAPLGADV